MNMKTDEVRSLLINKEKSVKVDMMTKFFQTQGLTIDVI